MQSLLLAGKFSKTYLALPIFARSRKQSKYRNVTRGTIIQSICVVMSVVTFRRWFRDAAVALARNDRMRLTDLISHLLLLCFRPCKLIRDVRITAFLIGMIPMFNIWCHFLTVVDVHRHCRRARFFLSLMEATVKAEWLLKKQVKKRRRSQKDQVDKMAKAGLAWAF
jgi:hypothetical protein